jgi:hypothetical protein
MRPFAAPTMTMVTPFAVVVAAVAALSACQGEIGALQGGGPDAVAHGSTTGAGASTSEGGGGNGASMNAGGGGAFAGSTGAGGTVTALDCSGPPQAGPAPLRRLTRAEYTRVIRDVFFVGTDAATSFAPDERVGGVFASNSEAPVASVQTQQFMDAAEDISAKLNVTTLVACDRTKLDDKGCARAFLQATGRRAYRRPLATTELDAFMSAYDGLRAVDDFDTTVRVLAQAMMQSPHFLYHLELDDPAHPSAPNSVARLPAFALASRLSFLFWGSVPDDALLDAAADGKLDTEAGLSTEARRLLEDARAADAISEFHSDWLGLSRLDGATRDPTLFPEFSPELVTAMRAETGAFADYVIRKQAGDLRALLTDAVSFPTGPDLGLFGPGEATAGKDGVFALDATKRAGLVTQPAFLAAHSHSDQTSPILRGRALRERFFCQPLKDPPPTVVAKPPALDPNLTTRERFAAHRTSGSSCISCHALIDDLGFALEHYDAIGRYRATENGRPIDATGILNATDVDGAMDGAIELSKRLSDSEEVQSCYAKQWFRYALGRSEQKADACSVDRLQKVLDGKGSIRDLLLSLSTSDSFVNRQTEATSD